MSAEELGFRPDRLARIPAFIQSEYLDSGKLPFAALLVGRGDDIALQWNSGVADDAIFRIASMTKPITSVAFMQLVEQGKVALTDPVSKYIPEFAKLGVFVGGGGNVPFMTRPPMTQMRVVDLRIKLVGRALRLLVTSGLATGVTVAVLFVEELLSADLQRVAATTFILAVGLMMWALVLFLRETQAASAALRIPDEYLEPDRRI